MGFIDDGKKLGRPFVPDEKKRIGFSTMFDPEFIIDFRKWCKDNEISQGRAIEIVLLDATNNFQDDISFIG